MTPYAKGLAITGFGGLILTIDIPMIMLAQADVWSTILIRAGCAFVAALIIWQVSRAVTDNAPPLLPGWPGVGIASLYGIANITFTVAVFNTTAANLVFILAFNTMFAALLAWLLLSERPHRVTVVTAVIMVGAILLIVHEGVSAGNFLGDVMAIVTAFILAMAITLTRKTGRDLGFAPAIGDIIPIVIVGTLALARGQPIVVEYPWWLIANGAVLIPIAFWCLASGPKYLSAPEVAMFYLLETVMTPVWVWLIFAQAPTAMALLGGLILITALLAHCVWQLRRARPG